ncbi:MAG: DUF979 domain-containing protein [Anaerolineaceae bacterium]|nr:DUF979 domain-containing protein [Anaerolineaceae bacterium]
MINFFFTDPKITLAAKLLEILFFLMGFICFYTGLKNLTDKENKANIGTGIFWIALAIVLAFGRWIPNWINGILVLVMTLPAILRQVKPGKSKPVDPAYSEAWSKKLNMAIFIPSLSIGIFALIFAIFTKLGALVGVGVGVIVAIIILMVMNRDNKLPTFFNDARRMLDTVGPLSMLPMLLASLGAIFTKAGVGDVIAQYVGMIIPKGNINLGIIVFAIAMPLFTIIMGNAFAAITVITVGIGAPFVLALGANPTVIGMLALTCGYCGTLCTPMAANFNIVPVALLDMKDRFGVIKRQWIPAIFILVFQIVYMLLFK